VPAQNFPVGHALAGPKPFAQRSIVDLKRWGDNAIVEPLRSDAIITVERTAMDTEKTETQATNDQDKATSAEKKPIVDQLTDIAAQAAGQLAAAAVKSVAKRAKKAVAKRIPTSAKKAAKKAVKALKKTAKKTAKKAVKKAKRSAKNSSSKSAEQTRLSAGRASGKKKSASKVVKRKKKAKR
jgi:hypothetical protein